MLLILTTYMDVYNCQKYKIFFIEKFVCTFKLIIIDSHQCGPYVKPPKGNKFKNGRYCMGGKSVGSCFGKSMHFQHMCLLIF